MILGCQAEGGGGLWFGEVRGQMRMNILTHMHENHNEGLRYRSVGSGPESPGCVPALYRPRMKTQACNLRTGEVESRGSEVQGHPFLQSESKASPTGLKSGES